MFEFQQVIVLFNFYADIEKLQQACKKRSLGGQYLHVSRVAISNCIIVQGIGEKIGRDTIEFYFENHRRSGGGRVSDVKMNEEDASCLVYFEDHEGLYTLSLLQCRVNHTFDGITIKKGCH